MIALNFCLQKATGAQGRQAFCFSGVSAFASEAYRLPLAAQILHKQGREKQDRETLWQVPLTGKILEDPVRFKLR